MDTPSLIAKLSAEQRAAYDRMAAFAADPSAGDTFCLHGEAGTGKTTLLAAFAANNDFATLCTLTGKAASVLRRKTGLPASTIHSFLYVLEQIKKDGKGRRDLFFKPAHESGSLERQIALVDECGMVGVKIVRDLLATGVRIIAVGDPGQLKPVGEEQYFTRADLELTEVHRQALDSPIIRQAHRVRRGMPYQADTDAFRVMARAFDGDIVNADIMLTWTNNRRIRLNAQARSLRGIWSSTPVPDEPIMCRRNYRPSGIYRGAIYVLVEPFKVGDTSIVINIDGDVRTIHGVTFDGIDSPLHEDDVNTSFTFGYAATVHSAAGSEWERVLLFDDYRAPDERERWQYTAITRASQSVTVVRGR